MTDEYITKREFDGFGQTVRGEFQRVGEQLTQVASKLDTLVTGRIEEARVLGEITGAIKAINERLERHERESGEQRRMQESELATLRAEIADVKRNDTEDLGGRLKWWQQLGFIAAAAVLGGWATRFFK